MPGRIFKDRVHYYDADGRHMGHTEHESIFYKLARVFEVFLWIGIFDAVIFGAYFQIDFWKSVWALFSGGTWDDVWDKGAIALAMLVLVIVQAALIFAVRWIISRVWKKYES